MQSPATLPDGRVALITGGTVRIGRAITERLAARPADLVLFSARGWTELLARPQADRIVLRSGRALERQLPDYRELDEYLGVH